jgi:hypothetical protein
MLLNTNEGGVPQPVTRLSDNSFDLSEQAPGVYFAYISQDEQQWVKKLVVR